MKEIRAVIAPERLDAVRAAVRRMPDYRGMTVVRARGAGHHPEKGSVRGIRNELTDFADRLLLSMVVEDAEVESAIRVIHEAVHTGRPGDGVVWIVEVEGFRRLREAYRNPQAAAADQPAGGVPDLPPPQRT